MTVVLSLLPTRPVPGLIENHERYAQMHGYQHIVVDGTHIYGERQQTLHRYHCIYQQLQALKNDELLLVLDVFSVIYTPHPLEHVVDAISLGTSPIYATTQHRFVHFPSQINHYRAATMRIWDEKST